MHLFPIVGGLIGFLAGVFAWLLLQILPPLAAGSLTMGFILLLTGLHHADGLLDFGDGIMHLGPAEGKIQVMHDKQTGAGGLALGSITILTTAMCISSLSMDNVIQGLVVAETSAKLAMVIGAWAGRSAHKGVNTYFVDAMHGRRRVMRLMVTLILSFGIVIRAFWLAGFFGVAAGLAAALIMVKVSNRHFGGVTGDVFGAMNEIGRMASLVTVLATLRWV